MSKITKETRQRIKQQILICLNGEAKTARHISDEINRSWNLTSKLLAELQQENTGISVTEIGPIKAYVKQPMPPLPKTT